MKVVHVVGGALTGGAAIGALQLHEALLCLGVDSLLLNNLFHGKDERRRINGIYPGWLFWLLPRVHVRMDGWPLRAYPGRGKTAWSCGLAGASLANRAELENADIIHLHWINEGFINLTTFSEIRKPVIWTMRDMWPLTGGCHYSLGCNKFETHCGACFQLGSNRENDLSHQLFSKKREVLRNHIHLVGASRWLSDCARASGILAGKEIRTIPGGASIEIFKKVEESQVRRRLGLPPGRRIILVGAQNLFFPYKGGEFLIAALRDPEVAKEDPLLVSFGRGAEVLQQHVNLDHISFGYVADRGRLAEIYAAADVFVMTSIQEVFAKTVVESLASGTPVVCFDTGGHGEVVRHEIDGFKAAPGDSAGLARGIALVLEKGRNHFKEEARKRAGEYDINKSARRYLGLYQEIMSEQAGEYSRPIFSHEN
jgi:glycosyltransferase involved in cell wall biosynthesis